MDNTSSKIASCNQVVMSEADKTLNNKIPLSIIPEFLFLMLKIFYYICEGVYRLIVPREEKSVVGEIVLKSEEWERVDTDDRRSVASAQATAQSTRPSTYWRRAARRRSAEIKQRIKRHTVPIIRETASWNETVMSEIDKTPNTKTPLSIIPELLFLTLKILYYICEGVYKLIVPKEEKSVNGEIVLITGAGQGLGRELAIGYASLGATVVCWDINKETNEQTVDEIKKIGKSLVYGYRCDVSDKDEVFKTAEKVRKEVGDITILINNAAVGPFRAFHDYNIDDISWVINVNFMAHYWTMKAFLPSMIEKDHGHVVAISSLSALFAISHGTLYCPTKSAVRAFMENIEKELHMLTKGRSSVKFTTILPGFMITNMIKNSRIRFPKIFGYYTPRKAASLIINAQRRDLKEKVFPSYCLPMIMIAKLLPDKAQTCLIDFLDIHLNATEKIY